jgi:hypothetical protein
MADYGTFAGLKAFLESENGNMSNHDGARMADSGQHLPLPILRLSSVSGEVSVSFRVNFMQNR